MWEERRGEYLTSGYRSGQDVPKPRGKLQVIQHGIEGSSKNYWSRGVGCVRLLPDASNTEGPEILTTSRNKPCCIYFTIPHKYFTSLIFTVDNFLKFPSNMQERPLSDAILTSNFVLEI